MAGPTCGNDTVSDGPSRDPAKATADDSDAIRTLLVDDDQDFVALASTLLEAESDRIETTTETRPADALDRVDLDAIDCIVSDYRMPEMDGIEFLETVRADYPELPFILFTGKGDEEVAKQAISADVSDYMVKDGSAEQYAISATRIENLVDQYRTQQRSHHRQRLDALSQRVLEAVLTEPTPEAIERAVCDCLIDDLYGAAWIGRRDPRDGTFASGASAGATALFEALSITTDREPDAVEEHAIADGEQHVAEGLATRDSEWARTAADHGFGAAVGVPIIAEGVPYGVLGVYTRRSAIDDIEAETLSRLADLTAFAIGASKRRRGDTSGQVVELTVDASAADLPFVRLADALGVGVELVETSHRRDGTPLTLYRVDTDGDLDASDLTAARETLAAETVEAVDGDGAADLAVAAANPWWERLVDGYGANVRTATAGDSATLVVELPPSVTVRSVVDHLGEHHPGLELVGRRGLHREGQSVETVAAAVTETLTDRQQEVVETAYRAGYYEWPHEASSEAVAELLGITQPTFAEHFWTAQRRIIETLLDPDERSTTD
ncbi:response regulator [Halonotius roseus]|uniref:Response regulator n=1 Tax=Halonotius roseus TaxID=2511997 RepID=A0A544QNU0_9EURY|nr:bacterio-opsin activator domain-containing protein [Halonotius roseus]TQQ80569.1 response regulator [Halonotius roseus]